MGARMIFSSSVVYPKSRWWRTTDACCGVSSSSGRQVVEVDQAGVEPLLVRLLGGQRRLDLVVVDDPALGGVDEEHAAGLEAALLHDLGRVDVEHADLRRHHDEVVGRDPVTRRAQAVAVEDGADDGPVRECHRRGAVPRLHQRGVVLVEGPPLRRHGLVVLPRLGDHHEHGVGERAAAEVQQLEHLVEAGRVAAAGRADREDAVEVAGQQVAGEQGLAGPHPVLVALHGVDLAVVGDVPVGVGQRPRRERVGREARVDEGERGLDPLVVEVREEVGELEGREHALVDERAAREAREVDAGHLVLDRACAG